MSAGPEEACAQSGEEVPRCGDVFKDMEKNDHIYVFRNILKFIITFEPFRTVYIAYATAQVEAYEVMYPITRLIEKTP
jgi:hypothetical protein